MLFEVKIRNERKTMNEKNLLSIIKISIHPNYHIPKDINQENVI